MASGYRDLTSRHWRISAVGAAACKRVRVRDPPLLCFASFCGYFFGAVAFFLAGFAVTAAFSLPLPAVFFLAIRPFSFFCRVRRRIFIDFRLSRRPMGSQYPDSRAPVKDGSPNEPPTYSIGPWSCQRPPRVLAA